MTFYATVMETLCIRSNLSLFDKVGEYYLSEKQLDVFTGLDGKNSMLLKRYCSHCGTANLVLWSKDS